MSPRRPGPKDQSGITRQVVSRKPNTVLRDGVRLMTSEEQLRDRRRKIPEDPPAVMPGDGGLTAYGHPVTGMLIGYARCSTDAQDLTAQRNALTALGVKASRIYVDHGLTGAHRGPASHRARTQTGRT